MEKGSKKPVHKVRETKVTYSKTGEESGRQEITRRYSYGEPNSLDAAWQMFLYIMGGVMIGMAASQFARLMY